MQRKTNLHHFQNKRFISYLSLLRKKDKVNLRRAWSNSCRSRLEMTIQWNLEHRNPASIDIPCCNDVRGIRNATLVRTELVVIHRRFGKNQLLDTIRTRGGTKTGKERKKDSTARTISKRCRLLTLRAPMTLRRRQYLFTFVSFK